MRLIDQDFMQAPNGILLWFIKDAGWVCCQSNQTKRTMFGQALFQRLFSSFLIQYFGSFCFFLVLSVTVYLIHCSLPWLIFTALTVVLVVKVSMSWTSLRCLFTAVWGREQLQSESTGWGSLRRAGRCVWPPSPSLSWCTAAARGFPPMQRN